MNLPYYIASRYLVARKSHNAINVISAISVMGVMVGTMALIVILSVFNGFDNLVKSLINSFNPDLKITLVEGKSFIPDEETIRRIKALPGVFDISFVLEDKALVRYEEQQTIAVIKGVSENYGSITGLDSMIVDGTYNVSGRSGTLCVDWQGHQPLPQREARLSAADDHLCAAPAQAALPGCRKGA